LFPVCQSEGVAIFILDGAFPTLFGTLPDLFHIDHRTFRPLDPGIPAVQMDFQFSNSFGVQFPGSYHTMPWMSSLGI
jgi:hypothetical protein